MISYGLPSLSEAYIKNPYNPDNIHPAIKALKTLTDPLITRIYESLGIKLLGDVGGQVDNLGLYEQLNKY